MSRGRIFFFVIFQFISVAVFRVEAQSPADGGEQNHHYYLEFIPAIAVMLLALIAAIFLTSCFTIYCRDSTSGDGSNFNLRLRGVDAPEIEAFPTFTYAEVKGYKIGKAALECAVCIEEFEEDETLRLIPKCSHVFHPECIDAWLEDHVTCPVCRADLTPQPGNDPVQPVELSRDGTNDQQQNGSVSSIHIVSDEGQQDSRFPWWSSITKGPRSLNKFRSHSTGHSMVLVRENSERYTLRLPEEVRKEVMNRALIHKTESLGVTLTREASCKRGYRGEGNSKSVRFQEGDSDVGVFSIAVNKISNGGGRERPRVDIDGHNAIISVMSLESKGHEVDSKLADSNLPPV